MNRDERQRKLAEIREAAADAVTAHSLSDERSELALLDMSLDDDRAAALERLAADDPVGLVWFGDSDAWVDARLDSGPNTPK